MLFFVDSTIPYDQFMHMLYSSFEINPIQFTITANAIFIGSTQMLGLPQREVKINTKNNFCAFVNVNNPRYVSSMKGHCHFYLIVEPVDRVEHSRPCVSKHTRTCAATVTLFKSLSESNQLSKLMPAMTTQFQYINQVNYMVLPTFHSSCSALQQNEDPPLIDHYVPRPEDKVTTIDGDDSPIRYHVE